MLRSACVFVVGLVQLVWCGVVLGQGSTFTYQGRFFDGGQPADGIYDIQIRIWDAPTAGNNLLTRTTNDLLVQDGLFTVTVDTTDLDGEPIFTGEPRWIAVGFRKDESSIFDPFSFVARQLLTRTPEAVYSERAGSSLFAEVSGMAQTADFATVAGSLSNPIWFGSPFDVAAFGDGTDEVLINTQTRQGSSSLIVNRDTSSTNSVLVSTSGSSGRPGVRFETGFPQQAGGSSYTLELDGSTGWMRFLDSRGSVRLRIESGGTFVEGDVRAGNDVEADNFVYSQDRVRRITLPASEWKRDRDDSFTLTTQGYTYYTGTSGLTRRMYAPIVLPEGAEIVAVRPYYGLTAGNSLTFSTLRFGLASASIANIAGAVAPAGGFGSFVTLSPGGVTAVVDNGSFQYMLSASTSDWGGNGPVQLGPVVIEYLVSEPD